MSERSDGDRPTHTATPGPPSTRTAPSPATISSWTTNWSKRPQAAYGQGHRHWHRCGGDPSPV